MNDDFLSKHRIDEMATISRPTDNIPRKSKVIVYGENDEQATKTPHFHVQIDNGDIELELHYWTEVSGIIEHYYFKKHNGFPIPNNMASKILGVPDSQITPSKKDMIHYNRVIGVDEAFTKMICGIKSKEIFYEVMSDFENNYDFMKEVNKMVNDSKETKYSVRQAIYIIENLYRMHEEDELNELIPKWHDALRDSVEVLNLTKEKTQTISDYIEYGNYLLSDTQILTLNDIVYTDEMLLEMASISQNTTGLDVIIWVQTNNTQSPGKHNLPQIKFQNNTSTKIQINELIPISISDNPEILLKNNDLNKIKISQAQINEVKQWIVKNQEILIDYWQEKITTDELFQKLKK